MKCLIVPVCFNLARFPSTPNDCNSDLVNFELLVQHELLLEGLKSKVVDVSLDFLNCFFAWNLRLPKSIGSVGDVRLDKGVIRENNALIDVVEDEVKWCQCVQVPAKNV